MTNTKGEKDASKLDGQRTSIGNSTTPRLTKEMASFIEKLAEKDSKRKKKKEHKKTEDGIVRRLAKQGLITQRENRHPRRRKEEENWSWLFLILIIIILRLLLLQLRLLKRLWLLERWEEK